MKKFRRHSTPGLRGITLIKSACAAFVLTVVFTMLPFHARCSEISNEVFRLHIIANSDSRTDQELKLRVRDKVLKVTQELFSDAQNKEQAEYAAAQSLQSIADAARDELQSNGCNLPVTVQLTNMYFTTREYSDFTLPSGMYDALRITIGQGEGRNWWCVMYPSICVSAASEQDEKAKSVFDEAQYDVVKNEKTEYKFKLVELIERIRSFFGGE